jgi:hypothetical protein
VIAPPFESASRTFETLLGDYCNSSEYNDRVHQELTAATWSDPLLSRHRRHVETNKLGFGDPAFHALWAGLLTRAARRFATVRCLEIGVFKGQVISLWSLIAQSGSLPIQTSALTPLAGQPLPRFPLWNKFRYRFDRRFRERIRNGDFYPAEDYETAVRGLFGEFGLDFDQTRLYRGYSTASEILRQFEDARFEIVYVDGDHTLAGSRHDFRTFGPKVAVGGWLVADDAGCDLPGTVFWKGHPAVSEAVRELPALGFQNIFNVGHNRVYERMAATG